jgi:hypothetical protein
MGKRYSIVCGLFCIVLMSFSTKVANATDRYTVCVGDCPPLSAPAGVSDPNRTDYKYDCSFAKANPDNLGEAAAKRVCYIEHPDKNYTGVDFILYNTVSGGTCGRKYYFAICK